MKHVTQHVTSVTSGSEGGGGGEETRYAGMDERKRKRMISNRESARRSRMKKQQHMDEMVGQVGGLKAENAEIAQRIDNASRMYVAVESENNVLRAQMMELTDRLRSLNAVLQLVEEVSGFSVDIPEIPDLLLEPWLLPCSIVQPVPNAF